MGLVAGIIGVVVVSAGAIIIAKIVNVLTRKKKGPYISFRESMDLIELPIVTFVNNGKKLNFLLDTGAHYSAINQGSLQGLDYKLSGNVGNVYGINGEKTMDTPYIIASLHYKGKAYKDELQVLDLSKVFGNLKEDFGVTLHGLIGSAFFQKYKYILDFDELIAYSQV